MLLNYRGKAIINKYFISTVSLCSFHYWLSSHLEQRGVGRNILDDSIYSGFDLRQRFDAFLM